MARTTKPVPFNRRRVMGRAESAATFETIIPTPRPPALRKVADLFSRSAANRAPTMPSSWQGECFYYAETIGEIGYSRDIKANTVTECALVAMEARPDDTGGEDEIASEDPRVLRVMEALRGPQGDARALMGRAATLLEIAGECYLVGSDSDTGGIEWEFLSTDEIKIDSSGTVRRIRSARSSSGDKEEVTGDVYMDRLFRPDPRFSDDPTCALRRVRTIANEVVILTQLVDAVAKSRLAAGILFVPDDITFKRPVGVDAGDDDLFDVGAAEESDTDVFTEMLLEHLSAPVADRTSAASLVPLIIRGASESGEKIRLIDVARGIDTWAKDLRAEALHRLAAGLDIPAEVMEGKGNLNHWTGYLVDADFVGKHVVPLGQMIANFLTSVYLRPMLVEMEGMGEEEATLFRLEFDSTPITARRDEAQNARYLYDRLELSGEALRRFAGMSEGDAPTEEEFRLRTLLGMIRSAPATMKWLIPLIPGFEDITVPATAAVATPGEEDPDADTEVDKPEGDTGEGDDGASPDDAGEPDSANPAAAAAAVDRAVADFALVQRLTVAADSYLERALERAGARIVSKLNGGDKTRVARVDKVDILRSFGPHELAAMDESYDSLLDWSRFRERARPWLIAWATTSRDLETYRAEEESDHVLDALCRGLTALAATGADPTDNGLRVPERLVAEAMLGIGLVAA